MKNMNQDDLQKFEEMLGNIFANFKDIIRNLEDKEVSELKDYIKFAKRDHVGSARTNLEIIKILFTLRELSNSDLQMISYFIKSTGYGWQDNEYYLSNSCLCENPTNHCKGMSPTSEPESAICQINFLKEIFLDAEYGQIVLYIFGYCLAALFSKRLNREHFPIPYYLQIACERNSVLFQLIEEIAGICDVNSGLFEHCRITAQRRCRYRSQVYYPTQSTREDLNALIRENSDVPIIVDGYERSTYYNNLLRAVANVQNSRTAIGLRDQFNVLPLFVCPTIKSNFGNVFNMDLSDLDVSTQYLERVRKNKQMLASHVLELVKESDGYLFPDKDEWYRSAEHPFKDHVKDYLANARKSYPGLTLNNATNIAFISLFFRGFFNVFLRSFQFSVPIGHNKKGKPILVGNYIEDIFMPKVEGYLADLHLRYLPDSCGEGIQNKEATQLARKIVKYYSELHISIRLTPVAVNDSRFIFRVETLQETKDTDVVRGGDTVQHRLKEYECFRFDMTDKREIKLIVAENQLQDNSLLCILMDKAFSDPTKKLPCAIGIDETGQIYVDDLAGFPHLLVGGSTNSGKSTALRSLLLSIAYKHRTGDAYVVIMDLLSSTGKSAFSVFNGHPIMACPVIQDPIQAARTILALRKVMESRPQDQSAETVPYIVCVIDEFPTLYNDLSKEYVEQIKSAMSALLSKGRHANIHLVLAAQDPSKDSVGNVSNVRARMAFYCSHYRYSVNIIGDGEAAKLYGKGQMILNSGSVRGKRLLGSYIDEEEMKNLLYKTKTTFKQKNPNRFTIPDIEMIDIHANDIPLISDMDTSISPKGSRFKTFEELLPDAIIWTLSQVKVANSRLIKYLHVRDAMGGQILNWMSKHNLILQLNGNHGWKVMAESYGDFDDVVIKVLLDAGYTETEIKEKISERTTSPDTN